MNSIPIDLVFDIFSRLPLNLIARCRCVSKLWWSMLHHPNFTEFFLTRSSARPRLLFLKVDFRDGELCFFSLPQPHNPYEKLSSLVVTAEFHKKLHMELEFCGHASGLFCFRHIPSLFSKNNEDTMHVICNPSTGQCRSLPKLKKDRNLQSFLGFDPIDKQFKILLMAYPYVPEAGDHRIMTLGTGKMRWRKIQCPLPHYRMKFHQEICINGVLYYLAENYDMSGVIDENSDEKMFHMIVCFDVRSEEFKFINAKSFHLWHTKFINYKGKLGGINWKYTHDDVIEAGVIELCVLEDVEKQEWSKYLYTLPENKIVKWDYVSIVGVTATGEIVLSLDNSFRSESVYVFYFNPQRNSLQTIEIRFPEYHEEAVDPNYNHRVYAFVDHVEDLRFDIIKTIYAATSSKAHLQQDCHTFESDKFDALCLLDEDEFTGVKT